MLFSAAFLYDDGCVEVVITVVLVCVAEHCTSLSKQIFCRQMFLEVNFVGPWRGSSGSICSILRSIQGITNLESQRYERLLLVSLELFEFSVDIDGNFSNQDSHPPAKGNYSPYSYFRS